MRKLIYWLKKESKIMQKEKLKLLYDSIKQIVKKKINENYNFHLIDTNKTSKWIKILKTLVIIPEVPRKSSVSLFRLITGHDCLTLYGRSRDPSASVAQYGRKRCRLAGNHALTCFIQYP